MSNTSMDYINQYLDDLKVQLQAILDSCNSLFQLAGVTQADTLTDVPSSIALLIPTQPEPSPEPEPELEPSNEEPGGGENEGV